MNDQVHERVTVALKSWVSVRHDQAARSTAKGNPQAGRRSSVTGGLHLNAINSLVVDEIRATGASGLEIRTNKAATLAGYYRASKSWDLVVLQDGEPILAVEYKSMSGSEGKNLNNRADEIFGMAEDARQAELNGLLPPRMRRAYVFVMGDNPVSSKPVVTRVKLGQEDPRFLGASYLDRMAIMCRRMRDTSLFHMTWAVAVKESPFSWSEPDVEVGWDRFSHDLRNAFRFGTPQPNPDMP